MPARSIVSRAASTRRFSTALAGDWPVSARKARLNWRGLRCAASASCSTASGLSRLRLAYASALWMRSDSAPAPAAPKTATGRRPAGDRPPASWPRRGRRPRPDPSRPWPAPGRCPRSCRPRSRPGLADEDAVFLQLHLREPGRDRAPRPVAWWPAGRRAGRPRPGRTRRCMLRQPDGIAVTARRRNLITPGVKAPARVLPPTITVSKFAFLSGSVTTSDAHRTTNEPASLR